MGEDGSGEPPGRRDPFSRQSRALGWILIVAGVVVAGLVKLGGRMEGRDSLLLGIAIMGIGGAIGIALSQRGRRHFAKRADEVLAQSGRPPVLYLRKFDDDELWEGRVALSLSRIGPVVAIGDPRDRLPPAGALRLYAADDDWQAKVLALIEASALIALKAGDTTGIRWEVQQVLSRVPPSRVLLFLPMSALNPKRVDLRRYRAFLDIAGGFFPKPLPALPDLANVIYFDDDWTPRPVATWKTAADLAASSQMRTDNRRTALEGLASHFDFRLRRRDFAGIGVLVAIPLGIVTVPWALRELETFTWWGLRASERDLVDRAGPRIEWIAASVRKALASDAAPSGDPAGGILSPRPIYGPLAVSPNTDILTMEEALWLTGKEQALAGPRLGLGTSLVLAAGQVRRYDPGARSRRPSEAFARTLEVASSLIYVSVVDLGAVRLHPSASPDEWRVSADCRLRVLRLGDGSEAASDSIAIEAAFREIDESEIGGRAVRGLRRPGDSAPPVMSERAQYYELLGWRVRRPGDLPNARARFARTRIENASTKAVLDGLARLTGGLFDGS